MVICKFGTLWLYISKTISRWLGLRSFFVSLDDSSECSKWKLWWRILFECKNQYPVVIFIENIRFMWHQDLAEFVRVPYVRRRSFLGPIFGRLFLTFREQRSAVFFFCCSFNLWWFMRGNALPFLFTDLEFLIVSTLVHSWRYLLGANESCLNISFTRYLLHQSWCVLLFLPTPLQWWIVLQLAQPLLIMFMMSPRASRPWVLLESKIWNVQETRGLVY